MKSKLNNLIAKYEKEKAEIATSLRAGPIPSEQLGRLSVLQEILETLYSLRR